MVKEEIATAPQAETPPKKRKFLLFIAILVGLIVVTLLVNSLLGGGVSFWGRGAGAYQAVFLNNGQIYFGKLSSLTSPFITLKDVYYLQVEQTLQPVKQGEEAPPQQNILLVQLGKGEIHKPKGEMRVNRDQILFIEDLQADSPILNGIKQLKESANQPPAPAQ